MKVGRPISRLFTTSSAILNSHRVSKSSSSNGSIEVLHAHLIRTYQHTHPTAMSQVITCYALFPPTVLNACFALDQIQRPTLHLWNLVIRGFSRSDRPSKAIQLFDKMREQGFRANNLTVIYASKACARISDSTSGQRLHVQVVKLGYESYLYVCNALIYMYASWGDSYFAKRIFDEMRDKDLVSWNSLICGYHQCNKFNEVLGVFGAMQAANVKADAVTLVKVLLASSRLGDDQVADSTVKYIDDYGVKVDVYLGNTLIDMYGRRGSVGMARHVFDRMVEKNVVSWNAMITGYAKAGDLDMARKLFDEMPEQDAISWTSMITGYCLADKFSDAIRLFRGMMEVNVKPDEITVASVLSACARIGSIDVGQEVHNYVHLHNVKVDIYVGNALIDMYCKCGACEKALDVFHQMKEKDDVSWTSIISGLAVNGFADHALELFSQMIRLGVMPSHGTYVGVLLACAHAGFVDEGLKYFESMERDYGLAPEMKHYGCIVDLLCRSGNLNGAHDFIQRMPIDPDIAVWRMLLSACKLYKDFSLAKIAAEKLLESDPSNGGNYVLSSSTYAHAERWDDATKLRELMNDSDVRRPFGWSSIELDDSASSKKQNF